MSFLLLDPHDQLVQSLLRPLEDPTRAGLRKPLRLETGEVAAAAAVDSALG